MAVGLARNQNIRLQTVCLLYAYVMECWPIRHCDIADWKHRSLSSNEPVTRVLATVFAADHDPEDAASALSSAFRAAVELCGAADVFVGSLRARRKCSTISSAWCIQECSYEEYSSYSDQAACSNMLTC